MPTPAYLSIKGSNQGQISGGASSDDSMGSNRQEGHEDEILIQAFNHNVFVPTNPQSGQPAGPRTHEPFIVTKVFDKSSPLLYNALCSGERLEVELRWFRTANDGTQEHYFTIALEDAVITSINANMPHCKDEHFKKFEHEEIVAFNYRKIDWRHEICDTAGADDWRTGNTA